MLTALKKRGSVTRERWLTLLKTYLWEIKSEIVATSFCKMLIILYSDPPVTSFYQYKQESFGWKVNIICTLLISLVQMNGWLSLRRLLLPIWLLKCLQTLSLQITINETMVLKCCSCPRPPLINMGIPYLTNSGKLLIDALCKYLPSPQVKIKTC